MVDAWDPDQYNRFAQEREQPFWDLVSLIAPTDHPRVADLGCGDGRLTAALHRRLQARETIGIDNSPAMIDASSAYTAGHVSFASGDIGRWESPGSFDVVLANASLQWVPDHRGVLRRLISALKPGGQLAVQVPANADHPAHRVAALVASQWLADPPPDPVRENVLLPETYCEVLDDLGCEAQHVRLQVYAHHLPSTAAIVEWVKGTTLNRFKAPLGPAGWQRFVEEYQSRLLAEMGDRSPVLYPFKRILLWGRIPK